MSQKVLSVSIAAYNVESFLKNTLQTLLVEEPYRSKLDVIIINDGSQDKTVEIAKQYAGKYPECIRFIDKPNGGYGSTINASLAIAKGTYYKLLDGDDWFNQDGLKGLLDYLETSSSDLVISPYFEETDKSKYIAHHPEIPAKKMSLSSLELNSNQIFQMHGMTVRTEVIRNFNHSITENCFYTDFEFVFYCIMAADTISRNENAVYCYRLGQEGQSVSLAGIRKHYLDYHRVAERLFRCYDIAFADMQGTKKDILEKAISFYTYCIFNVYMLLENPGLHRDELIAFDTSVQKKYPRAWEAGLKSRIVYLTRFLRFKFYGVICRYMMWKLKHKK
ncbi:MAG: glycosyltransferase family 2 protein [Acidaminococcaceae bacterium]|nr:glycosyltransferase family 2 protein [Acidaminococcaceae bacterium]